MRKKLKQILHDYKVNAYKLSHSSDPVENLTKEALDISSDVLKNAYTYHFHKLPDASRVEIINMINNYTLEAILPPIVEKIMHRIVVLEKEHENLLQMITKIVEVLDEE
ncbi:MAG TPA: hypothetical protein ENK02_13295 [Planctomycetes bacterium]|nr:hypothetical protein [Planctomycetota bacterium]